MSSDSCCFVPGCPNSNGNFPSITFHKFPVESQEEWLRVVGRDTNVFAIDKHICSEHFEDEDFESLNTVKTLKQNVIPSLNLPSKDTMATCETYIQENIPSNTGNLMFISEELQEEPYETSNTDYSNKYYINSEDVFNCRTCLCEIEPNNGHSVHSVVDQESRSLKQMLIYCVPQMASTLSDEDVVCDNCLDSIKFCVNFIENCLKVEVQITENYESWISTNVNETTLGEDSLYRHISLDHNYTPESYTIEEVLEETTEDNLGHSITNDPPASKHFCRECSREFRTKNYLLDHIRKIHGENTKSKKGKTSVFDCEHCDKSFKTKLVYNLHLQLSHGDKMEKKPDSVEKKEITARSESRTNTYLCEKCGKDFKKESYLKSHMLTHKPSYICHRCGDSFKTELLLKRHLKYEKLKIKYQCDQCTAVFPHKYRLVLHKKVRHLGMRGYNCNICDKTFCYEYNLQNHLRLKHSDIELVKPIAPYRCLKCGGEFANLVYLRKHLDNTRSKCNNVSRRNSSCRWRISGLVSCGQCDKIFKNAQKLRLHVKYHTQHGNSKCGTFTSGISRGRREKVQNEPLMLYRCEICFEIMDSQAFLDEHYASNHEGSIKYKCDACNKLFSTENILRSHLTEEHGLVEDYEQETRVLFEVPLQDYTINNLKCD